MRRRLAMGVLVVLLAACRKTPVENNAIVWLSDVESAERAAKASSKPVVVFVGASWDMGTKEFEHHTFTDPDVRKLAQGYVALHLDATDDEDRTYQRNAQRFKIVGVPSVIIYDSDLKTEVFRATEYVTPDRLASILRYAGDDSTSLEDVRARASYRALKPTIDRVRKEIFSHELMTREYPPWRSCYGDVPKEKLDDCLREEEANRASYIAAHDRFEHEVLPTLLANTPIVSLHAHVHPQSQNSFYGRVGPNRPTQSLGSRNVEVGLEMDAETKLGWGKFTTRERLPDGTTRGDDKFHPGLELVIRSATSSLSMVVLTDNFHRPAAWR